MEKGYVVADRDDAVAVMGELLRRYGSNLVQDRLQKQSKYSKQSSVETSCRMVSNVLRTLSIYQG